MPTPNNERTELSILRQKRAIRQRWITKHTELLQEAEAEFTELNTKITLLEQKESAK